MALTRGTERFGELAAAIEDRLASLGLAADSKHVDVLLMDRVRTVARHMGLSERTALSYAPDDVADTIARELVISGAAAASAPPPRTRHLRVLR